jgi:BirA family biotin operon repressor/biotin-[acetyl-CoA-carboxylase] ligase
VREINYIEVKEVSSTNDHLKKIAIEEELPEGFIVIAKNQTNGKGQSGNFWESEPGKNLTFSILLRPKYINAQNMFLISKAVSLGIIDYLNSLEKCFKIKWPNDIYYCNKKLGGILIENQLIGNKVNYSIVGIGINVNQKNFTSNAPNPISLKTIFKKDFNKFTLLEGIIKQITIWYEILADGWYDKINDAYFSHLFWDKGFHDFKSENNQFVAKIVSVDADGRITLKTTKGKCSSFYFKEIEFVIS